VEAQEARVVKAYEDALRCMQSGAAADAQVPRVWRPCCGVWRRRRCGCASCVSARCCCARVYSPMRAV
jgi:hypothetical protein